MARAAERLGVALLLVLLFVQAAAAEDAIERQVAFKGAGGTSLAGTLVIPAGAAGAKFPALVLVAGSGPTDRNGNQPPTLVTDLLRQIAAGLARHGVASLRFDSAACTPTATSCPTTSPIMASSFLGRISSATSPPHASSRASSPRSSPIASASLGTAREACWRWQPMNCCASDGVPPTVLVLVSTPGRTMDAVIHDQLVRLLAKQKANERETKFYLDENARIAKAVLETGRVPDDVPAGLKALYPAYLGKFLKSNFSVEPCNLAARFLGPVLVIAGEKDIQVSPELDAGALDAALKNPAQ